MRLSKFIFLTWVLNINLKFWVKTLKKVKTANTTSCRVPNVRLMAVIELPSILNIFIVFFSIPEVKTKDRMIIKVTLMSIVRCPYSLECMDGDEWKKSFTLFSLLAYIHINVIQAHGTLTYTVWLVLWCILYQVVMVTWWRWWYYNNKNIWKSQGSTEKNTDRHSIFLGTLRENPT